MRTVAYQPPILPERYAITAPSLLAVTVDGREVGAVWRARNNKRGSWRAITPGNRVSGGYFRTQDAAAEWLLANEMPHRSAETGAARIGAVVLLAALPGVLIAAVLVYLTAR
jgi:hypothetical protein